MGVSFKQGMAYLPLTGGALSGTLTLPLGAVGAPALAWGTTGIYASALNGALNCATNGVQVFTVSPADQGVQFTGNITAGQTSNVTFGGRSGISSTGDGKLRYRNNAGSAGFVSDFSNGDQCRLRNLADNGGASLGLSAQTAPSVPSASGDAYLYVDGGDSNKLKVKFSTGTVVTLATP